MMMPPMKTPQTVVPHDVAKQRRCASFTTVVAAEAPKNPTGANAMPAAATRAAACATRRSDIVGDRTLAKIVRQKVETIGVCVCV